MTDMMVDVETTGTNSHTASIIQLSAVKFNLLTRDIGGVFDRCPGPLPFRGWDDSTRAFWMGKNRAVFESIIARVEPPITVFKDFERFCANGKPENGYRFWSKPLSFDWPIVASHYEQLGGTMPFFYRYARDLNSFMAGLNANPEHPNMEAAVEFPPKGDKHNGLHDCAYQIEMLFTAMGRRVPAEVVS